MEGLIDDNCVLIACSMNCETAVTFTYGHFNKVVFAVVHYSEQTSVCASSLLLNGIVRGDDEWWVVCHS